MAGKFFTYVYERLRWNVSLGVDCAIDVLIKHMS